MPERSNQRLYQFAFLALIIVGCGWFGFTLSQLANFPRLHGDESGIMAPAYKLAREGVYGSDMYRGFYQADQHYLFTLPFHHFVLALAFQLLGAGVFQARLVSMAAGLLLLVVTTWLADGWFGRPTALVCLLLLLLWRSQLTAAGAPIAAALRSARYDMVAVLCMWLAIALLVKLQRTPQKSPLAWASGLVAGLASITQFYGIIVVPLLLFFWWSSRFNPSHDPFRELQSSAQSARESPAMGRTPSSHWLPSVAGEGWGRVRRVFLVGDGLGHIGWTNYRNKQGSLAPPMQGMIGFLLIAALYGGYVLTYWNDYVGQNTLHTNRIGFSSLNFYGQNLLNEFQRYRHLFWPSPRPGGLFCALVLIYIIYRMVKAQPTPSGFTEQRLARGMGLAILCLALVDKTKAPIYLLMITPGLCLLAASGVVSVLSHRPSSRWAWAAGVILALLLAVESGYAWLREWQAARTTTPYLEIGARIDAVIQQELGRQPAIILGPERWWWALHTHRYYADHNLWGQWRQQEMASDRLPDFAQLVQQAHIDLLLRSRDQMQGIKLFPALVEAQYWNFVARCTTPLTTIDDPTYGRIELLRVKPVC